MSAAAIQPGREINLAHNEASYDPAPGCLEVYRSVTPPGVSPSRTHRPGVASAQAAGMTVLVAPDGLTALTAHLAPPGRAVFADLTTQYLHPTRGRT